ncbi:MAG: heavy-metal-associated domain-containing protein [Bdellovibrionota bacterium]
MTCQGCVKGVERALASVDGVKKLRLILRRRLLKFTAGMLRSPYC